MGPESDRRPKSPMPFRAWAFGALALLAGWVLSPPLAAYETAPSKSDRPGAPPPSALAALQKAPPQKSDAPNWKEGFDWKKRRIEDDRYLVDLEGGLTAVLSIDASFQAHMEGFFSRYAVPGAGFVAIEPRSGRVLAYVSHPKNDGHDRASDASFPAASIFKIISAAALLEEGVSASERVCFHGGERRIVLAHLEASPLDRECATLSEALGASLNVVFARLADRHLSRERLEQVARRFGFGEALPFELPVGISKIDIPEDRLERARAAAGFWHSHLSPLHGALIAAAIARRGEMPTPSLVERVIDGQGRTIYRSHPRVFRRVTSPELAQALAKMMELTVTRGTSRAAFHDAQGRPFIPGVRIAGKTGTLSEDRPYRGYTWWVGFAPAEAPEIAIGVLLINRPEWRIKANQAAVEALRWFFVERKKQR
ncbi:MAG: penicillin-binding transpeptidase domain-containing protein [Sandaracinaceae bacterium]|nr:penicillin-binding transpeptidase domain-containing protein [Sandaracinaceae bacterium]